MCWYAYFTSDVLIASPHCNNAVEWLPETGALMFAVEHRYYGCHNASACPVEDVTASGALKYLSSRQALGMTCAPSLPLLLQYGSEARTNSRL